jgi:hypothetical protein
MKAASRARVGSMGKAGRRRKIVEAGHIRVGRQPREEHEATLCDSEK